MADANSLKLPKLQRNVPLVKGAMPSEAFNIWWQRVAKSLEQTISDIEDNVAQIQEALNMGTAGKRNTARLTSYTAPTSVLTGTDAGATASIIVAAHQRIYPNDGDPVVSPVSLTGGSITGLAFATTYYVYYDDTTLALTNPVLHATLVSDTAQVGAAAGRHFLGMIVTPADGAGDTTGDGGAPPGGINIPL